MADVSGEIKYDEGGLIRVETVPIPGRALPYEFVHRIGAVTILPILTDPEGNSSVLTISNKRTHYGTVFETPGGNLDGGFDDPEDPHVATLRELQEETGYQPKEGAKLDVFKMRDVSRTILYPRYFAVARNLVHIGGTVDSPSEKVTIIPTPLDEYLDTLLSFSREEAYPEVTLALGRAVLKNGRQALTDWLVNGSERTDIPDTFAPWLLPTDTTE